MASENEEPWKKTTGSRRRPADGRRNPSPRNPACAMACWQVPERIPRLGRSTRHKVRRHLQRRGTRRAIRRHICPDWLWAARRNGNESPAGRAPRWRRPADPAKSRLEAGATKCPQRCETKLAGVIGERCGNVHSRAPVSTGDGEEHRRNLTEHGPSLPRKAVASDEWGKSRSLTSFGMTHQVRQRPFTALTKFTGGRSHLPPNKGGCRTLCVFKGCGFCRVHCADEFTAH